MTHHNRPSRGRYEAATRSLRRIRDQEARTLTVPSRPASAAPVAGGCANVRREQDEYVCAGCSVRWGVDEDRPECPLHD